MTQPNERPRFLNVRGKLPAWTWRDLHAATREAKGRPAVLVVDDGMRPVAVMDLEDFRRLMSAMQEDTGDASV